MWPACALAEPWLNVTWCQTQVAVTMLLTAGVVEAGAGAGAGAAVGAEVGAVVGALVGVPPPPINALVTTGAGGGGGGGALQLCPLRTQLDPFHVYDPALPPY